MKFTKIYELKMDYRKIALTPELKRQRFEDRKRIKELVLLDYQEVLQHYGLNIPIKIYWRDYNLGGNTSGSAIGGRNETGIRYVVVNLRDDVEWFFSGGRNEVREVLVHEVLHMTGLRHNRKSRKMGYYSYHQKDEYSRSIVPKMFK